MSVAIITGASSGLGREFALQLYRANEVDEFYLIARREDRLKELKNELDGKAKVISADLTTSEGINKIREALISDKPDVKYLINASGFGKFGDYSEISEEETERMIDLNVKASVLITHMTIPYMKKGSHIIELGSGSCFTPLPHFNIYSSSKVFVLHYTKSLNYELKPHGIRATCFCPGWVDTAFLPKSLDAPGAYVPKKMKPLLNVSKVVEGCVKASIKGKAMYVTNWYTKLQHVLFKLVPDCILTKLWLGMLKKNGDSENK
jgi:short-subunit dehydrogenase